MLQINGIVVAYTGNREEKKNVKSNKNVHHITEYINLGNVTETIKKNMQIKHSHQ